jgi:hypothetical protein
MKFVICSYNRPALIKKKTLSTLARANIPAESIFIFAGADSDPDFARYATLEADGYHVIRAPVGLANARNMVLDCFPPGEELIFMDDDVTNFVAVSLFDLATEARAAFDLCKREGCSLWGAYPVPCKLWMAEHALKGALFIQGCFFGLINPGAAYRHGLVFKEDWERTLFFWKKEGAVIRFENFAPIQKHRGNPGGLTSTRTLEAESLEATSLLLEYGDAITTRVRKGWPELYFAKKFVKDRLVI